MEDPQSARGKTGEERGKSLADNNLRPSRICLICDCLCCLQNEKVTLTMEDLAESLKDYGVNVNKPEYYHQQQSS